MDFDGIVVEEFGELGRGSDFTLEGPKTCSGTLFGEGKISTGEACMFLKLNQ